MFETFWNFICRLFGKEKNYVSSTQQNENEKYADEYMDISDINITAMFSNKLANLTVADSSVNINGDTARAVLLADILLNVWRKLKKAVSAALGTGGCAIVPFVQEGKIYFDMVKQNRVIIHKKTGDNITSATILADVITIDNKPYYRFTDYTVTGNTLYVQNKVTNSNGSPAHVEQWENLKDMAISNVDRVPFGFIKCPVDNRKHSDEYGVPITYGCKKIIDDIKECLVQINDEFALKRVRLQVDGRTLDKDPKTGQPILKDKLYIKGTSEDGDLFNIFNPDIRESSFFAKLDKYCALLENQVGTSPGIITKPETKAATATEIIHTQKETFSIVDDIRTAIEKAINDFIYACDVLANYYNLTPAGKYEVSYDWDYSMRESSSETWQQMKELQSVGGMSKAELRAWQTGEELETAQKAIDDIAEREPTLQSLMGLRE